MTRYLVILRRYLGWCPHAGTREESPGSYGKNTNATARLDGSDGSPATATAMPDGFTMLSIIILFATLFVGGYFWWPALVLGITGAGILVLYVRTTAQGSS